MSRSVCIPRERESMHMLVMGDTGHGKTVTVLQVLCQIEERGEAAIIYDPKREFLPQFYEPERGDIILNPLDERCPFWNFSDEVLHPAEALTLAESLFPDKPGEEPFFLDTTRDIFAYLLNLKPTPEQFIAWLCDEEEIQRRVKGSVHAIKIDARADRQMIGVLSTLGKIGSALSLLPREDEAQRRWSAAAWAKERKGWIFITSSPTTRAQQKPLISLWLDLLVLRLMNTGTVGGRKTWFVLDELASLQRLPQLETALTESRTSQTPVVLSFQGKGQIDERYGKTTSEAMLSQAMTKVFLKTNDPASALWISDSIGEVEVERVRETRTQGQSPQARNSEQRDITREPLVMASQITGPNPLDGYLKHGNLVVDMRVPYLHFEKRHPGFIEREPREDEPASMPPPVAPCNPSGQQTEINQGPTPYFE
jgi:type IV secretory pathway TraG/TraD family ATPase VirD4